MRVLFNRALLLPETVWPMWWCRQRALRKANADTPLVTLCSTEFEPRACGPVPPPPAASAPPLEHSQRLDHNGLKRLTDGREAIGAAPAADDEAYIAVAQPVLPHAGGGAARAAEAAVAPEHEPAVDNLPLAPSLDEPSEDMTAQCPTPRLHRVILELRHTCHCSYTLASIKAWFTSSVRARIQEWQAGRGRLAADTAQC